MKRIIIIMIISMFIVSSACACSPATPKEVINIHKPTSEVI